MCADSQYVTPVKLGVTNVGNPCLSREESFLSRRSCYKGPGVRYALRTKCVPGSCWICSWDSGVMVGGKPRRLEQGPAMGVGSGVGC